MYGEGGTLGPFTRLNSWLALLTLHVKALPNVPEASGVQAPLRRLPGAVHGTDHEARAPAGKEPLGNFDQDSSAVSSDTLAYCFCSLVCFEHLSRGGHEGSWQGGCWRLGDAVQCPSPHRGHRSGRPAAWNPPCCSIVAPPHVLSVPGRSTREFLSA